MKDEINEKVAKGREEGRREGIINAIALCKDFGADKSETSNKIAKQFSLSIESATRLVEENW
jgi:predicted transposase YdaD